mmetsp:Transcript_32901/g.75262  ORF Transcript_32901/g.75262 Transcript_32901/m.75262 type:complete len:273 (+) Transcript_32901:585-1403(+)
MLESAGLKSKHSPLAIREMNASPLPVGPDLPEPVTRFSFIKFVCSRPFLIDHCVTRPSVEIDTIISPLSTPLSTHRTSHTASLCLPLVWLHSSDGTRSPFLISKMATVPSYKPTARRLGDLMEKSRAVTPHLRWYTRSGYSGFLRDQMSTRPSRCAENSNWPYATARMSFLVLFQQVALMLRPLLMSQENVQSFVRPERSCETVGKISSLSGKCGCSVPGATSAGGGVVDTDGSGTAVVVAAAGAASSSVFVASSLTLPASTSKFRYTSCLS